ncbi:MAG TPA: MFS transporter, partial [Solirubrobacteraceae bacterium]|nr:MFS transporter [Solirubrobacteraceae bacterium]
MGDFVLLYPLYALLFSDAGLSTAEISSLFAIWSATGFVLEVPSGIWADAVSRRLPLALAPLLSGCGFAIWVLAPSYPTFALGFVLWGAQGALQSGALEALVYEELEHAGEAPRYAQVMGRAAALGTVAVGAAMGLAAPVFAAGGFDAIGAASVIACLAAAAVGATFPEHRTAPAASELPGIRAHLVMVRTGLEDMRHSPALRRALLVVPAVTAVWGSLEEYVPLLALETGVERETVPLLALLVAAATAVGGMLAGRANALSARGVSLALAGAAVALAFGALSLKPAGFILLAVAFAGFQALTVVADARLQDAIEGPARSTVTSVAG